MFKRSQLACFIDCRADLCWLDLEMKIASALIMAKTEESKVHCLPVVVFCAQLTMMVISEQNRTPSCLEWTVIIC